MSSQPRQRVLDWRKRRSWLASIRHYASSLLTAEVREHVRQARPDCWPDDMSWLPDHGWLVREFSGRMADYYSHFKAFHGCRPVATGSYLKDGLIGQNKDNIQRTFRQIYSEWPPEALARAIEQVEATSPSEAGKVWLLGCDRKLVEGCGHYLIQGSEYLMTLAGALGEYPAQQRLRNIGVPTIFEVDLPVSYVPAEQRMEVARNILSAWGQGVARRPLGLNSGSPCFEIRRTIPPEHIRGHWHPEQIVDPHRGCSTYYNPYRFCPVCRDGRPPR